MQRLLATFTTLFLSGMLAWITPFNFTLTAKPYQVIGSNLTLDNDTIAENQPEGSLIGLISTTAGNTADFSLADENSPFSINVNQLVTNQSLNYEEQASYTITIIATGENLEEPLSEEFTITVLDINDAPQIISQTALTTPFEQAITLSLEDFTVTDEDADDIYPEGFSLTVEAGTNYSVEGPSTVVPATGFSGVLNVPLYVNDGESDSEIFVAEITVQEAEEPENVAPVADASNTQTTYVDNNNDGVETVTLDGRASTDEDGSIENYVWSWEGGSATGETAEIEFEVGTYEITLTVTDDDGAEATGQVTVTINAAPNQAPLANAGPDQNVPDEDDNGFQTVSLNGSDSEDPDGEIVSYIWTNEEDEEIAIGINPSVNLPVGIHLITLTVTDDDNETDTDEVSITVEEAENQTPIADAGGDITVTDEDNDGEESINLDGSNSSDPDEDELTYLWFDGETQIASGVSPNVTLAIGNYTLRLEVSDGEDADTDEVNIIVNAAETVEPTFSLSPEELVLEEDFANTVTVSLIPETDTEATYSLVNIVDFATLSINANTGSISVASIENAFGGPAQINVTATDINNSENAFTASFSLQITAVNDDPVVVNPIEDIVLEENAAAFNINISDVFEDVENNNLAVSASSNNSELAQVTINGVNLNVSITPENFGTALITLSAEDSEGGIAQTSFTITVEEAEDLTPFFTLINEIFEVNEDFDQPVEVAVQPDNESQSVSYSITPPSLDFATLTANNEEGIYIFTALPDQNGEEDFTITAESVQGDTHQESFIFRVNAINDAPVFALAQESLTVEAGSGQQTFDSFATGIAPGPLTATDEQEQELTFATTASNPAFFEVQPLIDNEGNLSFTPAQNTEGVATVEVTLSDDGPDNGQNQNAATQSFTINIDQAQLLLPEFSISPTSIEVNEDFEGEQTIEVTPTDLSLLPTYRLEPESVDFAELSINVLTGTVTITAVDDANGEEEIQIIATSLLGETYSQTFSLTVNAVNDAPFFSLNGNPEAVEVNAGPQSVANFATNIDDGDPDEEQDLEFVLEQTGGDLSFAGDVSINVQGTLTYEAAEDATGSATFEVYLQDDGTENNVSETQTFTITVEEAEAVEPTFTLNPETLILEEDFVNIATVSVNPETSTQVTYSLNNNVNSINFATVSIDSNTGTVSIEAIEDASGGPAQISVTATDINDANNSFTASFTLQVTAVNDAPIVINPIDDVELEENAASFNINISNVFEDVEDNNLDITASSNNTELAQVSINGVNLNINITPEASGNALITLTAEDDEGESAQTSFEITVVEEADATPFFTLVQEIFEVNEDFTQNVSVEVQPDDDDQEVSYSIVPSEIDFATLTANNDAGIYTFTSRTDLNGEEEFTITAENQQGDTHQENFTFRVMAVNDQPVFELTQTNVTAEIAAGNLSFASFATNILPGPPTATDEQSQTLAFTATAADPTLFDGQPAINNDGTLTFTPADDNAGSTSVEVTLTDNVDLPENQRSSSTATFNIEVVEQPTAVPVASDVEATTAFNTPVTITLDAVDEDGDMLTFSIVNQPTNGTLGTISGNEVEYTPNTGFSGEDTFTFQANDAEGPSNTATVTITINELANELPIADAGENQTVAAAVESGTQTVTLDGSGSNDPDGTIESYVWTWGEDQSVEGVSPDIILAVGTYTITLTVTDDDNATATDQVTITVNAPAIDAPTEITLDPAAPVIAENQGSVTVGTLSADGTAPVTFSLPEGEENNDLFTINGNQLTTNGALDFETTPILTVQITATNSAGNITEEFTIDVSNVEEPPTEITLSSTTVANGTAAGIAVGSLSATGGAPVDITFSLPDAADNTSFTIQNGNELTTAQVFNFAEQQTYEIVVRASGDGTLDETFTINVTPPDNTAPVANNVSETTEFNIPVLITLSAEDGDGDALTFSIVAVPTNGSLGGISENQVTYTPNDGFSGQDTFTFQASDGQANSNVATATVTVSPPDNQPPTANAGNDQTVIANAETGTQTVTLDGSGSSDPDGEIISYLWTNEEAEEIASEVNPSINLPVGVHVLTLTVTDNLEASATDQVTITVSAPETPAFTLDPVSFAAEEDFEGTQTVDIVPANPALVTEYSFEPALNSIAFAEVSFDADALAINILSVENAFGEASITVTAITENGATAQQTLTLAVASVNDAPVVANEIADVNANENNDNITIDISNVFTDVDDDELILSASSGDANLVSVTIEGNTLVLSFGQGQSGSTTVSVTATDDEDASITETFSVNVAANAPPLANAGPDQTLVIEDGSELISVSLNGSGSSDPDGDIISYIWTWGSNTATGAQPTINLPVGTTTLTLTVTDNDGATATDQVVVVVQFAPVLEDIERTAINFANGSPAVTLTETLSIRDEDNINISSATVQFDREEGFFNPAEDELLYPLPSNISIGWFAQEGRLELSGQASIEEYETVLRSIQYNNRQNNLPTPQSRKIDFTVNDGEYSSNTLFRIISVAGSNTPPIISDFSRTLDEDTPQPLTYEDFAANFEDIEDDIVEEPFNGIVYLTIPTNGFLEVDGNRLTSNQQEYAVNLNNSTLRYVPAADYFGEDSFTWIATDSREERSSSARVRFNILPVNDAPRISAPASVSVNENSAFNFSDTRNITIEDVDNPTDTLSVSMTVQAGVLNFANTGLLANLIFTEGDGVDDVTMAFRGIPSDINAALTGLQYRSNEGFSGSDAFTISATDPLNSTGNATVNILVNQVNTLPTLTNIESEPINYNEESGPVQISNTISIEDRENNNMIAATISISENFVADEDQLTFSAVEGISGRISGNRLILTGNAPIATYETVLRSIQYVNNSEAPQESVRRINFQVTDVNNGSSNVVSRFINVTQLNSPLRLANIETDPLTYQAGDLQQNITQTLTISDADNGDLTMAIVRFAVDSYIPQEDVLILESEDFEVSWNEAEGVLTISGTNTLQAYQDALRSVQYFNNSATPALGSKFIRFTVYRNDILSNEVERTLLIVDNELPILSDVNIEMLQNTLYTFSEADFSNHYNDPDNSPENLTFVRLRISELPVRGQLYLNEEPITQEVIDTEGALEVSTEELSQLTYQPEEGYLGLDSLEWNAYDGEDYAIENAKLIFNIIDLEVNAGEDLEICQGDPVSLTASVNGGSGNYTFSWSCDQPECGLDNANAAEISVSPNQTTAYFVNVTNANGLTSNSDTIIVSTVACDDLPLEIPTAFTPNGDGPNDSWVISNIETYENQVVEVFDRYGKQVFFSEGYRQPWDGSKNGQILPAGTYYYLIRLNNGEHHHRGSVSILK